MKSHFGRRKFRKIKCEQSGVQLPIVVEHVLNLAFMPFGVRRRSMEIVLVRQLHDFRNTVGVHRFRFSFFRRLRSWQQTWGEVRTFRTVIVMAGAWWTMYCAELSVVNQPLTVLPRKSSYPSLDDIDLPVLSNQLIPDTGNTQRAAH